MDQFEIHARCCGPCTREYENELSIKGLLQRHTRMVHVPADLQVSIVRRIDREARRSDGAQHLLFRLWRVPLVRAALAVALTALLVVLSLDRLQEPSDALPFMTAGLSANNVVRQSVDNYHKILRGEIVPQIGSNDPLELRDFFTGRTSFPVLVPRMKECAFVGGVVNEHNGTGLAHVLYHTGSDVIYLYQAGWETVKEGKMLEIAPEAKTALLETGWYIPRGAGNDAVVLWTHDRTLCIAVSHMGLDRLLASVKSGADSALEAR